jgi:predicted Fe-S protein YdhL (DUF1289 family)
MPLASPPPLSPCRRICALEDGRCVSCGRTLEEIASWLGYSPQERAAIMAQLPARLAAMK